MNSKKKENKTILVKFASRERPRKFFAGLNNIFSQADDPDDILVVFSGDTDDRSMYNNQVLADLREMVHQNKVLAYFGKSENKIHAINRNIENAPNNWNILINFSDDMEFTVKGYDTIIKKKFEECFPDYNGNLHFNDGFQSRISTMSIIGRMYFDGVMDRKIYNPVYKSLFADEEYTEIAKRLNKIQYIHEPIFIHNHPANLKTPGDALLRRTEGFWDVDQQTYNKRHQQNFLVNV